MMKDLHARADVVEILAHAQDALQKLGVTSCVRFASLPGAGETVSLVAAVSRRGLHAAVVALEDGVLNAYCDIDAFSAKVNFSESENAVDACTTSTGSALGKAPAVSVKPAKHGKRWKEEEDIILAEAWKAGGAAAAIRALARRFGRSEIAIAARLVHLRLAENREQIREIDRERHAAPSGCGQRVPPRA